MKKLLVAFILSVAGISYSLDVENTGGRFPASTIGTLTVTGNETVGGTLGVSGTSTLTSSVTVNSTIQATGNITGATLIGTGLSLSAGATIQNSVAGTLSINTTPSATRPDLFISHDGDGDASFGFSGNNKPGVLQGGWAVGTNHIVAHIKPNRQVDKDTLLILTSSSTTRRPIFIMENTLGTVGKRVFFMDFIANAVRFERVNEANGGTETEIMRLDTANDRVGIGTTAPATKLHMSSGTFTMDGTGAPAAGGALCLNAANAMSKCTSVVDISGNCTCP